MRAIIEGKLRVLAIMPTGRGKSLFFILPAFCRGGGVSIISILISSY